jgi:hypothetical protein
MYIYMCIYVEEMKWNLRFLTEFLNLRISAAVFYSVEKETLI